MPQNQVKRGTRTQSSLWRWNIVLVVISILLGVALVEGWLRFRESQEKTPFTYDSVLGWNAKLHFQGRQRTPEFDVLIRTNGQRMRADHEVEVQPTRFRIAVVGDSFAWGHGVNVEERFSDQLVQLLGPGVEVINFGIGGFGTDQIFLRVWNEVVRYRPDILVVAFFVNDLIELDTEVSFLGTYKPRFLLRDGQLELAGVPVPRLPGWDRTRPLFDLAVLELMRKAFRTKPRRRKTPALPYADHFFRESSHIELLVDRGRRRKRLKRLLGLNAKLYAALQAAADSIGAEFVVVEVPFKEFFMPSGILDAYYKLTRSQVAFARTQRHLARLSKRFEFLYVNPYPVFAADQPLANYFRRDQHLNGRGHALLAQVLAEQLVANQLVASPEAGVDVAPR